MHLHFVLDEPQYNVLLEPLIEHARRARHTVTLGERTAQRYDADAYILIQDFGLFGCPEPKVLLTHALGLAKKVAFSLDVQLMIFPSSAYRDCVASEIPPETEVVAGVGSSKIDILLDRSQCREQIRERIRKTYGFDERPIVGYCPTFRHDGSLPHPQRSHRLRDVEQILGGNFNVIVLHHSLESDVSEVDELKFRLDPAIPRVDHLVALDFAVSDISGIGFELCAIDIPTVLLDEPSVPGYLDARIFQDGRRLDYGPTCSLAELAVDASRLFEAADGYQSQRAHWATLAFGPCDGKASKSVLAEIVRFAANRQMRRLEQSPTSDRAPSERIADFVSTELQFFKVNGQKTIDAGGLSLSLSPSTSTAFYGPYIRLGQGRFFVRIDVTIPEGQRARFSIDSDQGRINHCTIPFATRLSTNVPFEISSEAAGLPLEFRLFLVDSVEKVEIRRFELIYVGQ